jgi:formate hydrogenlyase subunit 3/multisubunit Na+/H+ antiporter MnhD subunit
VVIRVAHGFLAALTFGLSGYIYTQTGTLEMSELGGLAKKLRFIGVAFTMAALAGCGLPGFLNFVGEVTVFFGAWQVPALRVVTVLAVWGALIIGAVYMLRAVRAALHGAMPEKWAHVSDANLWRKLPYALLLASLLVFGFFPRLLTDKIKPVTEQIVNMVTAQAGEAVVNNSVLNRPHPGPLPQERESVSQPHAMSSGSGTADDSGAKEHGGLLPPLPGGEGQGEGGRVNISKKDQGPLTSAATKSE